MKLRQAVARAIGTAMDYGDMDAIFAAAEHSGDCTGDSWTCAHCQQAELLSVADAAIAVVREALPEDAIRMAIFDPGKTQGYRGDDRSLTQWQTDAVMVVLNDLLAASPIGDSAPGGAGEG